MRAQAASQRLQRIAPIPGRFGLLQRERRTAHTRCLRLRARRREYQIRAFLAGRDRRNIGVGRRYRRKDRRIHDAQAGNAVHAQLADRPPPPGRRPSCRCPPDASRSARSIGCSRAAPRRPGLPARAAFRARPAASATAAARACAPAACRRERAARRLRGKDIAGPSSRAAADRATGCAGSPPNAAAAASRRS